MGEGGLKRPHGGARDQGAEAESAAIFFGSTMYRETKVCERSSDKCSKEREAERMGRRETGKAGKEHEEEKASLARLERNGMELRSIRRA